MNGIVRIDFSFSDLSGARRLFPSYTQYEGRFRARFYSETIAVYDDIFPSYDEIIALYDDIFTVYDETIAL